VLLQQHPPRGWAGVGRGAPPAPATSRKQATSHQQPAGARRPAKRAAGQAQAQEITTQPAAPLSAIRYGWGGVGDDSSRFFNPLC
jgi:hypothetical protein